MRREGFQLSLAYLVGIFEALNALNLKLQGKNINIIMHHDTIRTFMAKLDLWKCRIQQGNTASFSNLDSALIHGNLDSELKKQVITHLTDLKTEFIRYFPEIVEKRVAWKFIRNPFQCEVADVSDEVQEEFLELKFISTTKENFKELDLETFWIPECSKAVQDDQKEKLWANLTEDNIQIVSVTCPHLFDNTERVKCCPNFTLAEAIKKSSDVNLTDFRSHIELLKYCKPFESITKHTTFSCHCYAKQRKTKDGKHSSHQSNAPRTNGGGGGEESETIELTERASLQRE
ncbi:Zinc finger BED domain-containing protein 5-like 5 [Homarus americanus]|uniref:Zinc finger BED domain-containing protein 5-like 5 n=1 Tax=Homarus americanus TaxID=6706 RepID=A0A8J5MTJ4_HOMAM|nr:Zinc finger BED domain-containing protein 5-like 5 [Homarus americanus]